MPITPKPDGVTPTVLTAGHYSVENYTGHILFLDDEHSIDAYSAGEATPADVENFFGFIRRTDYTESV